MNAIIFAAGLGTRLQALTSNCPKALVEINGKPLLWYAVQKLQRAGVKKIVVNVHHFAGQLVDYIEKNQWQVPIAISDESDELLDTGGALLKARDLLGNAPNYIAYNVDVISDTDLKKVLQYHERNKALATLVVKERETSRYFMFDEQMLLTGWKNTMSGEEVVSNNNFNISKPKAFSGIQVISNKIFDKIEEQGKFSVTPMYLRLASTERIMGYNDVESFWLDAGKPEALELAAGFLLRNPKQ